MCTKSPSQFRWAWMGRAVWDAIEKALRPCYPRVATTRCAVAVTLAITPAFAAAQATAPAGVVRLVPIDSDATAPLAASAQPSPMLSRIGLGVIGATAGSLAGAYLGARAARNCPYDECAWWDAVLGGAVGAVFGSGIVAGAPTMQSRCGTAERIAAGAAMALVSGVAGGYIGAAGSGLGVVVGFTAGTSIGAGIGASLCG